MLSNKVSAPCCWHCRLSGMRTLEYGLSLSLQRWTIASSSYTFLYSVVQSDTKGDLIEAT